ncbi:hypothetical protein RJ640_003050, partial [Escallonia rubra]
AYDILATNWSSPTPVCNWVGVICSSRHNRVAALNLSNMGLVGTIPPDIGNISFLASLDISNNKFCGSLPKEMAHLRRLREMLAEYNELSGVLPSHRSGVRVRTVIGGRRRRVDMWIEGILAVESIIYSSADDYQICQQCDRRHRLGVHHNFHHESVGICDHH